jgi:hypothetical protein
MTVFGATSLAFGAGITETTLGVIVSGPDPVVKTQDFGVNALPAKSCATAVIVTV